MSTTIARHEKNLNTLLKVDAILTIAGGIAGGVLLARIGGEATTLTGVWAGVLGANVVVWSAVFLRGVWDGVRGKLRWDLNSTTAQAPATPVDVTRRMEETLATAPAAAPVTQEQHEEELELVA